MIIQCIFVNSAVNMHHFASCSVFLFISFTSMVHVTALPQKRNYKDIVLEEIDIVKMGDEIDKASAFDIKDMKGGKTKGVGVLKVTKDWPPTTTVQWKVYFTKDDNQLVKQAEGKRATICDFIVKEKAMADMMLTESNVTTCVIKEGVYNFKKCAANMDVFPPKIPENRDSWLLDIVFAENQRVILSLRATAKIVRD